MPARKPKQAALDEQPKPKAGTKTIAQAAAEANADKEITAKELKRLVLTRQNTELRIGEERSALGDVLRVAEEKFALNKWAFEAAFKLGKKQAPEQARSLRALNQYCELLELGTQTDIEDAIKDAATVDDIAGAEAGGAMH